MQDCNQLQPNQHHALELLTAGQTVPEVAEELAVDRSTVWRWTQDPTFASELSRSRRESLDEARQTLQGVTLTAVSVLVGIATDSDLTPGVRLRACCAILDRAGISAANSHQVEVDRPELNFAHLTYEQLLELARETSDEECSCCGGRTS